MNKYKASIHMDIEGWAYEQSDLEEILVDWLDSFSDIRVLNLEVDFGNPPGSSSEGDST